MRNKFAQMGTYVTALQDGATSGWVVMTMDDVAAKGINQSALMKLDNRVLTPVAMKMFRTCFTGPAADGDAVFVGDDGNVTVMHTDRSLHDEFVTGSLRTPQNTGHLRAGTCVGEDLLVVGMQRQVYRRAADGGWSDWMSGLPTDEPKGSISGFEAVTAVGPTEVYAGGWDGELWEHDGTRWARKDSPTNQIITGLGHAADSPVYGCGRNGLVLRGRHDAWEVILHRQCPDDLWSIVPFKGHVYAASLRRLYRITNDTRIELVDVAHLGADSFAELISDGETLWSVGAKDLLAFNGSEWLRIA